MRRRFASTPRKWASSADARTSSGACRRSALGLVGLFAVALAACGGQADPSAPTRPLPPYSGGSVELFDDTVEPAGVGLDFDKTYNPRSDVTLRERTQTADAVLRVRVQTVSSKTDGADAVFRLGLSTVEKLAGEHPPPSNFTVRIDKNSASYGILKNFESRLVGYPFIAFVREFIRPDGESELHFHLSQDTKDVKAAVSDAQALSELK